MVRLLNQADWRIERAFACCYLGPARQLHKMNVPRLFLGLGGGVRDLSGLDLSRDAESEHEMIEPLNAIPVG